METSLKDAQKFPSLLSRTSPRTYANPPEAFLDQQLPGKWIWKGVLSQSPARSPDLTTSDFFLWGYTKDVVYQTKVQDLDELRCRITAACETVTPVMLQNTWRETECRLDICRATEGTLVEVY
jgi:hypothetical protein